MTVPKSVLGLPAPPGTFQRLSTRGRAEKLLRCVAMGMALLLPPVEAWCQQPGAWAYVAWWLPESWRQAPLAAFERLLFFHLTVGPNGAIEDANGWPDRWGDLREATMRKGIALDLTLTTLDSTTFSAVFESPQAVDTLLQRATELASQNGVAGLQLDFEVYDTPSTTALQRFRQFVPSLVQRLNALKPARQLSVFMPMGGDVQIYDRASLAAVHRVVAQGYDAHWAGSANAGPVAPLDGPGAVTWKKAVAQGRLLGVPESRLLMGFPYYGYEWAVRDYDPRATAVARGEITTLSPIPAEQLPAIRINVRDRVAQYGCSHDAQSGSSYYQYQRPDGPWVVGWYEGSWALERKRIFLRRQRIGGIAFFLYGYDGHQLTEQFFGKRKAHGPGQIASCF